ncbi:MAG: DUF971 domain-containing protein [Pyrinomonadaceae bacterium]|jgi:DUF971 family protein|nr:DUF971 domain-containing protein [Pyrinomonadaceae bacterium]
MLEPTQIIEESDSEITIEWSDDKSFTYNASELRKVCPCAGCVNEWTGERMLKSENVADNLTFKSTGIVGRYALNFVFSDEHDTGIFSFKYLREIAKS